MRVYSTYHLIRCSSPSTSASGRLHTHRTCPWLWLCVGDGVAEIVDELLRWPGVNRCRCPLLPPLPVGASWAGAPGRLLVPACITFLSSAAASPKLPPVDGRVGGGGGGSCWSISIWSARLVAGPFRGFRRSEVEEKELRSLTERCRRFCVVLLAAVGGLDIEAELRGGSGKLKDVLRLGIIMGSSSDEEEPSSSSTSGLTGKPAQELRWLPGWLLLGKTGSRLSSSSSSTTVSVRARPSSSMTNLTDANLALLCRACVLMVFSGIEVRLDSRW